MSDQVRDNTTTRERSTGASKRRLASAARALGFAGLAVGALAFAGPSAMAEPCDSPEPRTGPAEPAPRPDGAVTIFEGGTGGVDTFRIPGAITTPTGAIVVAAEQRAVSALDSDPHSLVSRRSTDGGRTWGPIAEVAPLVTGDEACLPSDPVLLAPKVGPTAGEVLAVHHCRGGELRVSRSNDDGASWSAPGPLELAPTPEVPQQVIDQFRPGPGHGVQLTVGPSAGRLVAAADTAVDGQRTLVLIVSDDGGQTWRIGATSVIDQSSGPIPDETAVAELADGTLVLSSRNASSSSPGRIFARSLDGGDSFATWPSGAVVEVDPSVTVPVVQGSMISTPDAERAVFASPTDPQFRRGLVLWTSTSGAGWAAGPLIVPGPAAYSDLVTVDDDTLGLVVETGDTNPYERIDFVPVPVSRLDEPRAPLPDDFDVAGAVAGRLVIGDQRFAVIRFCLFSPRVELEGGSIEFDISNGLDDAEVEVHVDDGGDGQPLDLSGTVAIDTKSGIVARDSLRDASGTSYDIDLVMVNFESCPPAPPACPEPGPGPDSGPQSGLDPAREPSTAAAPLAPRFTG